MQSGWNRCGDRFKNLGNDMLGRDEVDVVTTLALKVEHKLGDLLRWALRADGLLADVPVLAEDAAQVAQAEEDRPRTIPAA